MRLGRGESSAEPAGPGGTAPVGRLGVAFGVLRCGIGAVMLADPPRLARVLGVDTVTARQTGWLTMMIGGRELALGVGTLLALGGGGRGGRSWYAAQAVADGGDAVALALAIRANRVSTPVGVLIVATAVGGSALDVIALRADGPPA